MTNHTLIPIVCFVALAVLVTICLGLRGLDRTTKTSLIALSRAESRASNYSKSNSLVPTSSSGNSNSNSRLSDLRKKIQLLLSSTENDALPSPPQKTLGAFVHVGKTGGSTLSVLLRNGCHSFVPKPCEDRNLVNESYVSKTSQYYHAPDFRNGLLFRNDHHDYYVFTVRDPFARTVSAFLYSHPSNVLAEQGVHFKPFAGWRPMKSLFESCFPTLNQFAHHLEGVLDNYTQGSVHVKNLHEVVSLLENKTYSCSTIAKGIMRREIPMGHFDWTFRTIGPLVRFGLLKETSVAFAIRTENLWRDWETTNRLLGQPIYIPTFSNALRNSSSWAPPVKNEIDESGRKLICRELVEEYQMYFRFLLISENLSEDDVRESYGVAKAACPWLDFTYILDELS